MSGGHARFLSGAPNEDLFGFAQGVRAGDLVPGTVVEQLAGALARFERVLGSAGATLTDVVATHVFVAQPQDEAGFAAICDVHRGVFGEIKPSSTLVFVPELPVPGASVLVTGVAAVTA